MKPIKRDFNKSFFKTVLTEIKYNRLNYRLQILTDILSIAIFLDGIIYQDEIVKAREIVNHYSDESTSELILDKIELNLGEYIEDSEKFENDKNKIVKTIVNDIQLYSLIIDIFNSDKEFHESEKEFEELIKEEYEKRWS